MGLVANDNGHHREPKFDNEDEHRHFHIDTFQTFMARLHEQEQILNRLLRRVGSETIDDPMPNDRFECTPFSWMVILRTTVEKHSHQTVFLQALPVLLVQLEDSKA